VETGVLIAVIVVLAGILLAIGLRHRLNARRTSVTPPASDARRILFPFVASGLSARALDAALRLARAEQATLLPVFLAQVPMRMPLDAPLPRQSAIAISLQEAIEQRAAAFGVQVEARITRGRTIRHALRETLVNERFDRVVVAAASRGGPGFEPDDVAWLLKNAPGEIVVLRPSQQQQRLETVAHPPEPTMPANGSRSLTPTGSRR
jgi:nucleotide-binding universal stress UspA family protein